MKRQLHRHNLLLVAKSEKSMNSGEIYPKGYRRKL